MIQAAFFVQESEKTWNSYRIPRVVDLEDSPLRAPYIEDEIWGSSPRTKLKEGMSSEINFAQFPREPSTAKSARFIKVPLNTRSVYRSDLRHPIEALTTMHLVCRNARSVPWVGEETLAPIGERDSTSHDIGPRTSKPSSPSEEPDNRIFRGYCGAEGFGKAQPISYQSQGLCRGGRSARGRMKGIQTAKI